MRRVFRNLSVLGSAAAALLAMILLPGTASAAGNITLLSSGPTTNPYDPYVMSVQVNDGNGLKLTSMTVHIYSGATDVYDVNDMAYSSGATSDQTWIAASPIPQADLPIGTYTTTVDVTDTTESDNGLTTGQQFSLQYTVTLTAAARTVSYGDSTITMSGRVTGVVFGSPYTTPVGVAGVPITLANSYSGSPAQTIATTMADGSFSGQVTVPVPPNLSCGGSCTYYLTAVADSTELGTEIYPSISWKEDATRLVGVKVTPEDFVYHGTTMATMTGTAEYDNAATGWQLLTNFGVLYASVGQKLVSLTTNSKGQFIWKYSPSLGTAWSVSVIGGDLLYSSGASGSINVAMPVQIKSFSATLSPFAILTASACEHAWGNQQPASLLIQYAARPAGPWKPLGHIGGGISGVCGRPGFYWYKGQVPVVLASAYYRAVSLATPNFEAASSKAVRLWKYVTRVISVHVSPARVPRGGKITVSGRLQTYKGAWRDFGHQQVLIILRPKGSKVWYWIVKAKTDSSGHFSSTFKDPVTAHWTAQYDGDATHFASIGSVHYVTVSGSGSARGSLPAALPQSFPSPAVLLRQARELAGASVPRFTPDGLAADGRDFWNQAG